LFSFELLLLLQVPYSNRIMATLVPENHLALHSIAQEIPKELFGTPKLKKILKDMLAGLDSYKSEGFVGVAIAAPQIGLSLRIFLVHDTSTGKARNRLPDITAINPTIVKLSKTKKTLDEGCLSVRDKYGSVKRSERATLRAYDENGKIFERGASGLLAQIFQHECDHLDGILFVDRATKIVDKKDIAPKEKKVRIKEEK